MFEASYEMDYTLSITELACKQNQNYNGKTKIGENKINLKITDLTSGIYFVSLRSANQNSTSKLVVE